MPKIHKQYEKLPKGRPIIAGCGSNTERISWFCDQLAKNAVKDLPSYIEDTPHLLRTLEDLNDSETLPNSAKPISLDIKSMYTNIPIKEGLDAFKDTLEKRSDKSVPTDFILKLLKLIMEQNIFTFNEEYWLQLLGTCMGTRVAPTYANLFMGVLEQKILENCPPNLREHIYLWKRFIDDILIVWTDSWDTFKDFFNYLNNFHETMKFDEPCYDQNSNSCNFLDLNI